jgi:hypothetical protein
VADCVGKSVYSSALKRVLADGDQRLGWLGVDVASERRGDQGHVLR